MADTSMTTTKLKQINRRRVYQLIYEEGGISKQAIATRLQMSLSTVSQNLCALEQEKLIERSGYYDSTGGRRPQMIRVCAQARVAVGMDILKDMLLLTAVDLYGTPLCRACIPMAFADTDEYRRRLAREAQVFLGHSGLEPSAVLGVSIAIQGIPDRTGQGVSYGEIMHNTGMQLKELARYLPFPCRLEHDSKAAAFLELWQRRDLQNAVVLLLNCNLGGAVVVNRRVLQGTGLHGGLLEHLCIDPDGPRCYCGRRGCLETYCSAESLEKAAGMPAEPFFRALRAGDSGCVRIWDDYLRHLAFAMANLNVVLNAPVIVSGLLAPYLTEEDAERLTELAAERSPFPLPESYLTVSGQDQYAPALGAALYYIHQFLETV